MGQISRYWTMVKLSSNGRSYTEAIAVARQFFQVQFPDLEDDISDRRIQQHLWQIVEHKHQSSESSIAELCLRCFISHQVEQVCIQLEKQFGDYYGFTRSDLFAYVLDDDGKVRNQETSGRRQESKPTTPLPHHPTTPPLPTPYQPLGIQILQKFTPDHASLITWTTRLVRQHSELNQFLLERGLCMLSDWAILNDTTQKKLRRVLTQFHHLTEIEVQQNHLLLESYHAIYRRDRIQQGQKGQCVDPTLEQLQAIAELIQQSSQQNLAPSSVLARLHTLADRLRQHRIATRGGSLRTQSLDQSEHAPLSDSLSAPSEDPSELQQLEFLQAYRQQFLMCLESSLEQVLRSRQQKLKPPKDQSFLTGLYLLYCQRLAMTKIAVEIDLKAQYEVTRLLKLKELRVDVRHGMLNCLRQYTLDKAKSYLDLDQLNQLDQLDQQIDAALSEQIDGLMQEDEATATTPKEYASSNLFAQQVCQSLDRLLSPQTPHT